MKTAVASLEGVGCISFSRRHDEPKLEGELDDAYEERTWREKLHYDSQTNEIFVPGIAVKFCLDQAAKQLGLKVPGKGNTGWANKFKSGVLCPDRMMLGVEKNAVKSVSIYCHPQGYRSPGKRVLRTFPLLETWQGTVTFMVLDDLITEEVFRLHLGKAGQFCGLGRFAPRVGGYHGRFDVAELLWHDAVLDAVAAE